MKDLKKRLLFCLPIIVLLLFTPLLAKAEGEKFDNNRCVVPFDLVLSFDGQEKYLRSSYGILVGINGDGGASNIITNVKDVRATGEEIQNASKSYRYVGVCVGSYRNTGVEWLHGFVGGNIFDRWRRTVR